MLEPGAGEAAGGDGRSSLLLMGGELRGTTCCWRSVAHGWSPRASSTPSTRRVPNGGPRSFPSGHTSIAFSGAEFIRKEYGWRWAAAAYAAAGFVGWSRAWNRSQQHYVHDVLAGAALGILANHDFWLRREPDSAWATFGRRVRVGSRAGAGESGSSGSRLTPQS